MKRLFFLFLALVLPILPHADVLGKREWTWDTTGILPLMQGLPLTGEETKLIEKLKQGETSEVAASCLAKLKGGKGTVRLAWLLAQCSRLRKSLASDLELVRAAGEAHDEDLALAFARYKLFAMAFYDKAIVVELPEFKSESNKLRSHLLKLGGQEFPVVVAAAFDAVPDVLTSRTIIDGYKAKGSEVVAWQLFRARAYSRGTIPLDKGHTVPLPKAPKVTGMVYPDTKTVLSIGNAILSKDRANSMAHFYIGKAYALLGKVAEAKKALRLALASELSKLTREMADDYVASGNPMAFYRHVILE